MAKATAYIEMAWRLGQHPEVGDHLGQLFEKQGRRDEAIKAYALALAATRPSSEIRTRLAALLGADARVDAFVERHREQLGP